MCYNGFNLIRGCAMGDPWDYRLRRMEMAWELALRVIPKTPQESGAWTEDAYIARAQEVLKKAAGAVKAVFKEVAD